MHERTFATKLIGSTIKAIGGAIVIVLVFSLSLTNNGLDITQAVDSPLITYANVSRTDLNIGTLTVNNELTNAAQAKAEDILNNQYFDHTRSDGKQPWDFIKESGYNYRFAGENLAMGYNDYVAIHKAWLNSPSHKRNILNNRYNEIGIGVAEGIYNGKNVVVVVEMLAAD